MKKFLAALCALGSAAIATPAIAADPPVVDICGSAFVSGGIACKGYYGGNLLQGGVGSTTDAQIQAILTDLLDGSPAPSNSQPGYAPPYPVMDFSHILGSIDGTNGNPVYNFGSLNLSGLTLFGAHFGNSIDSDVNNVTAFWLLDLGANTTHSISVTDTQGRGVSNAQVFATGVRGAVPEPATWAMMLLGFGAIGMASRRRRAQVLPQIA